MASSDAKASAGGVSLSWNIPRSTPYWLVFGSGLVLANMAYLLHNPIGWTITLLYFLFVPGYLSLQFIARKSWSRWETLSFSLGLSLLFIMVVGLCLNAIAYLGVSRPLTTLGAFVALDIGVILLLFLNFKRRMKLRIDRDFTKFKWHRLLALPLLLLPVGAAAGAIRLNNGASGEVTLVVFACIAVIFVLLMLKTSLQRYYPMALFLFALSILLSVSLRGWDITGHDIQREFNVFQLTMQQGMWNIAEFRDPYNACLSITLLPAILAHITGIPDAYIFKVVFQFIAAFAVIPAYFFVRRLHGPRDALLAGFIFLLFPTFLNDMAMLNRQEIAFLFFGLIMLLMLLSIEYRRLQILTVLLLIGLTLSHYSSSYIMIGLMLAAWIVNIVVTRVTKPKFATENVNAFPIMTLPIIVFAGIFVFTWNDQITQTTKGLNSTITKTLEGLGSDKKSSQASDVSYSLLGGKSMSPQEILESYTEKTTGKDVSLTAVQQPTLPITTLGSWFGGEQLLKSVHGNIRGGIAKLLQVLIVIGCAVLWWRIKQRKHSKYDLYVLSLCGGSALLLITLTVLPQLSVDYGVLRLFQQLLFILALPIIAGLVWIGTLATKKVMRIYAGVAFILAFMFLHTSGFLPQVTGGYAPQLALNNSGFYYDAYYTTQPEREAASWLAEKADKKLHPETSAALDVYGVLRFSQVDQEEIALTSPFTPSQRAYVYHYKHPETFIVNINSNLYYYKVDRHTAREDTVYSNGDSHVGKLVEAK